ncbi:Regulator of Vps4 activity in the MVB pathway protein [Rhynchospora pubera]|uniref:Regulator of Vps4 activity in the MVB pathway protein n=1 Tax=Rhynchospora pubera TaxID=906938 RepID=A0AAV8HMB6_9POAL|nr:Regulator of Vps4 activity in the MVB pathway protein [Rhynchospora pubera]
MLGGLLGSKFSNKCKHSIKCIRTRLDPIRKKKQAVVRYLRRDVAELISHGHDLNAFERMEALIMEINQSSCYDMIEQYCADILNQLPVLQKERECPDEAKEAVSTLIFAAARFSDLPELCDLRRVFAERFGGSMESFVNSEFVKRAQDKTFSDEKKIQIMQGIAEEFSVRFDLKDLHRRMSTPAEAKSDLRKKPVPPRNEESHLKLPKSRIDDNPREKRPNVVPVITVHKQEVRTEHKVVWDEPRKLRAEQQVTRDEPKESQTELENIRARPKGTWARPREFWAELKDVQAEPKDIHVVPSKPERVDLHHRDSRLPAGDTPKKHHHKTRHGYLKEASYSIDEEKPGLGAVKSLSEKEQGSNGLVFDRSRMPDDGSDYSIPESNINREDNGFIKPSKGKVINMAPPYTKPKATRVENHKEDDSNGSDLYAAERAPSRPVKDGPGTNMVPPYVKPGFEQQTKQGDHYGSAHGERPRPVSVRSKVSKPPLTDAKTEDGLFEEANMNRTPSMRSRHGHRHEITNHDNDVYDKHRHRDVQGDGVNGETHDRKRQQRWHKNQGSSANFDEEEEEDNAIDYGNLLRGTPRSHRRHRERRSSRHESERDEEERMMDKLLLHYSRKSTAGSESFKERTRENSSGNEPAKERNRARPPPPPPLTTRPSVDRVHHAPERAASLPADTAHEEVIRFPARAASLQPDLFSPNGGRRVHPNLPDYDELAARLHALRNA